LWQVADFLHCVVVTADVVETLADSCCSDRRSKEIIGHFSNNLFMVNENKILAQKSDLKTGQVENAQIGILCDLRECSLRRYHTIEV
jgi:hypothetical protein